MSIDKTIKNYVKGIDKEVSKLPSDNLEFREYHFYNFTISNICEEGEKVIADVRCKAVKKPLKLEVNVCDYWSEQIKNTLKDDSINLTDKTVKILAFKEELKANYEAEQIKKVSFILDELYIELMNEKERIGEEDFFEFFEKAYRGMWIPNELAQNPSFGLVNFMSSIFHNPEQYEEMKKDIQDRDSSPIRMTLELRV